MLDITIYFIVFVLNTGNLKESFNEHLLNIYFKI